MMNILFVLFSISPIHVKGSWIFWWSLDVLNNLLLSTIVIPSLDVMRAHPTTSPPSPSYILWYIWTKTSTDLETVELGTLSAWYESICFVRICMCVGERRKTTSGVCFGFDIDCQCCWKKERCQKQASSFELKPPTNIKEDDDEGLAIHLDRISSCWDEPWRNIRRIHVELQQLCRLVGW